MTNLLKPGDIKTWSYQADPFLGQYRIVEHLGGNKWAIEYLAPSEESVDAIVEYAAVCEARGARNYMTNECPLAEVEARQARAGERSVIRLVPSEQYHAAF